MDAWMRTLRTFIIVVLAVVLALALAAIGAAAWCAAPTVHGGAVGGATAGAAIDPSRPLAATAAEHPIGAALREHARALLMGAPVGVHPLDRDGYTGGAGDAATAAGGGVAGESEAAGGAARRAAGPRPLDEAAGAAARAKPRKPWQTYATWAELRRDPGALAAYMAQRAAAIERPDFDWTAVLAAVRPKLADDREHIGIIGVGPDGRTLHVVQSTASPVRAGRTSGSTTFAAVPAELVAAQAERPGLFIFHTHVDDPRGSPLPSSHDLAAAVYFGALAQYAANVIVSAYGVLVYGIDWGAYRDIRGARDPRLAALNLSHDVVAAHETIRSWSAWKLPEYLAFYPRYRLFLDAYPSSAMVGDSRRHTFRGDLEAPIDHELLRDQSADIAAHHTRRSARRDRTTAARALRQLGPAGFD